MTLDEAARILGISAEAPAEEVLRAYFRLAQSQETRQDPEGLNRVREALGVFSTEADSPSALSTDVQPEEIDRAAGGSAPYLVLRAATFTRPFATYSDQYYQAEEAIKTSCDYDPEIYRSEVCYAGINLLRGASNCPAVTGAQVELLQKIAVSNQLSSRVGR